MSHHRPHLLYANQNFPKRVTVSSAVRSQQMSGQRQTVDSRQLVNRARESGARSLMMCQVSGTKRLDSAAKAWLPVRGAPKV